MKKSEAKQIIAELEARNANLRAMVNNTYTREATLYAQVRELTEALHLTDCRNDVLETRLATAEQGRADAIAEDVIERPSLQYRVWDTHTDKARSRWFDSYVEAIDVAVNLGRTSQIMTHRYVVVDNFGGKV